MKKLIEVLLVVVLVLGVALLGSLLYEKHFKKKAPVFKTSVEDSVRSSETRLMTKLDSVQQEIDALKNKPQDTPPPVVKEDPKLENLLKEVASLREQLAETCQSKPEKVVYQVRTKEKVVQVPTEKIVVKEVEVPVIPCENSNEYFACVSQKEAEWHLNCSKREEDSVDTQVLNRNSKPSSRVEIQENIVNYTITPGKKINVCSQKKEDLRESCRVKVCSK